jgi:WD40 repeat protein
VFKVKENKFFILSASKDTYICELTNLPQLNIDEVELCQINMDNFKYEEMRFRIIKHTFRIDQVVHDDSYFSLMSNEELIYHTLNQKLKVSAVDSVEEITEMSSYDTGFKFKIIFIGKIFIQKVEHMIVIYKDLTCELFIYDKKQREIKKVRRFMIMIEDEFLNMNYTVTNNLLIGYVENFIHILDLSKIEQNEKYVDQTYELSNIFSTSRKELFFTNYFKENFPDQHSHFLKNIGKRPLDKMVKDFYAEKIIENLNKIDNIKKKSSSDLLNYKFKITCSTIFSSPENSGIYYITGTNCGKISIIDIFMKEGFTISPMIIIDYHTSSIETLNIYENKYLIASSSDGMLTITDISKEKLESAINRVSGEVIENFDFDNIKQVLSNKESIENGNGENKNPSLNLNYYYSKRKSLSNINIENNMIINAVNDAIGKKTLPIIDLLPVMTIKNYSKVKKILTIYQLDNFQISFDENFKRKQKNLLALENDDNSAIVVNMDTLQILYRFNINSDTAIKAVYHISYEKCLVFYLENNTVKVCNYVTRTADRTISSLDKIFSLLRVDEKLKLYFQDTENILISDFKVNYENSFQNINTDKEKENPNFQRSSPKKSSTKGLIETFAVNNPNTQQNQMSSQGNQTSSQNLLSAKGLNSISLEFIKEQLHSEREKKLFMQKYIHLALENKKEHLNITFNKFEAAWMKRAESLIIEEIFMIINSYSLTDKLKKIEIMNLLYNPTTHYKIFDKYEYNSTGVENLTLYLGEQLNSFLTLNLEDYFLFIEKFIQTNKNITNSQQLKNNYYNFISLFHIWNLSLDQDINIINFLKIHQPIFDFNFILFGKESAMSLILNEEAETDGDFSSHNKFFIDYIKAPEQTKKQMKEEKYCNKKYIVNRQQGYLVGIKNFKFSSNLSHYMNMGLFGSMIAALGFEEANEICRLVSAEKVLLRSLAQQKYIKFSNLNIIDKFMYDTIEDITLCNKDIILVDFLIMKFTNIKDNQRFQEKLKNIVNYLSDLYSYIFNFEDPDELFNGFYKLHKERNIEKSEKLLFLTEFELSMINIIILYNSISMEKITEIQMIKVVELLILYVFKALNPTNIQRGNVNKVLVELLGKCTDLLDKIYKENMTNYSKFLIDLYTNIKIPIDLDGLFKKYELGNCIIIKSEDNFNFLKIMLAKLLKNFSKIKINFILKIIVEEFKRKSTEYDYFSYLLEILWILFRERNAKHVQFLPTLINLIMTTMSPQNKDMRNACLDNSKKVLSCLLPNYPMISFHQNSQKLAVGANDGKIYIYDLTSGNIWKSLSAHTNEILALTFDFSGNKLISYSSTECTVKFWNVS